MLKLNVNQEKQLTFALQLGGVQTEQVQSHLRIEIDGIEYGFPASIGRESVTVDLPPLRSVTARKLKEGEEVQMKLEIIADGNYLTPWTDTVRLANPLVVEAKIVDDDFNPAPAFKTRLVHEGKPGDQKQGVRLERIESQDIEPVASSQTEDDLTEKIVEKLARKLRKLSEAEVDMDKFEKAEKKEKEAEKKEKKAEKIEDEAEKDEKEAEDMEKAAIKKEHKKIKPVDLLNMTEEDVYLYIERAGTKNPTIQKIIFEQAEAAAQSSRPVDILKQVVKIMKK